MKKGVKLLILLLVLALVAGGLFAVTRYNAKQESLNHSEEEIIAAAIDKAEVAAIRWTNDKNDISLSKDEKGYWHYDGDPTLPLDNAVPEGMLNSVSSLIATRLVAENPADTAQYGFNKPGCTAVFTMKDGSQTTLTIGNESGYDSVYFKSSDSANVYLVSSDIETTFSKSVTDLVKAETFPTCETIPSVTVQGEKTTVIFTAEPAKEDDAQTAFTVSSGDKKGTLTPEHAAALESEINGLKFGSCAAYKGETEKFGLAKPAYRITVNYTNDSKDGSFTLLLGNKTEEGMYYAMLQGSDCIFTLAQSSVNTLTEDDITAFCTKEPTTTTN